MKDLLIHPRTAERLEIFLQQPAHALLLVGPPGSGKGTVARRLAETLLNLKPGGLANYPYQRQLASQEGKAIGIDAVREFEGFLSLKVPGRAEINRIIIIEDSNLLTLEAQNALLKTLEEPPGGTIMILTAHFTQTLLPTILSRLQIIELQPAKTEAVKQYFAQKGYSAAGIDQAYAISGGLPGLMQALLDDADHPLLGAIDQAKRLLQASSYERLLLVDSLARQRQLTEYTLLMLQQMAHISLQSATGAAAKRWQSVLTAAYNAQVALNTNGQVKLTLLDFALGF